MIVRPEMKIKQGETAYREIGSFLDRRQIK